MTCMTYNELIFSGCEDLFAFEGQIGSFTSHDDHPENYEEYEPNHYLLPTTYYWLPTTYIAHY